MKIIIAGASGNIGQRLVAEGLARGHDITAVARNHSPLGTLPADVAVRSGDISRPADVASLARGQHIFINATRPDTGEEHAVRANTRGLLQGLAGTTLRLLIVGGAASLVVPGTGGKTVIDTPRYLSPDLRHIGQASLDQYRLCAEEHLLDWAYLCPPAELFAGRRSAQFRRGGNILLLDSEGHSRLSMEDLAVALFDEIDHPRHYQQRFTAAY